MRRDTVSILLPSSYDIEAAENIISYALRTFYEEYDFDGFEVKYNQVYAILRISEEGSK